MKEKTLVDYQIDEKIKELEVLLEGIDYRSLYYKIKPILDSAVIKSRKKDIYLWFVGGMRNLDEIRTKMETESSPYLLNESFRIDEELRKYLDEAVDIRSEFWSSEETQLNFNNYKDGKKE